MMPFYDIPMVGTGRNVLLNRMRFVGRWMGTTTTNLVLEVVEGSANNIREARGGGLNN